MAHERKNRHAGDVAARKLSGNTSEHSQITGRVKYDATRIPHYRFGPRAIEVARFIRGVGATPTDRSIALLAEIDKRWPDLSLHDLHGAAVLAAVLALKTEGNA